MVRPCRTGPRVATRSKGDENLSYAMAVQAMALPALFKTQLVWQAGKFLPMVELLEPRKEEAIES